MASSKNSFIAMLSLIAICYAGAQARCPKTGEFSWGNAMSDEERCTTDPTGKPLNPNAMKLLSSTLMGVGNLLGRNRLDSNSPGSRRQARLMGSSTQNQFDTILRNMEIHNGERLLSATARMDVCREGCNVMPESCCEVRTEVAYPQFGQSAITEETFTIIQDFPDFVQPIFKRVCVSATCNLLQGNCTQKYVPHAVFSAPSGKFSNLFGQDYLLVESGCECKPHYIPATIYGSRPSITKSSLMQSSSNFNISDVNDNRNSLLD